MSKYYAIVRSTDSLAHYGVKGMKWGVRKAFKDYQEKRANRKFDKKVYKNSRSAQFPGTGGYMSVPAGTRKDSDRMKLSEKWSDEWYRRTNDGAKELSEKETQRMDNKYRNAYVKAVLKDAKLPINKKNVARAHSVLAKTDSTFARYYNLKNKSYKDLVEDFHREDEKDVRMYKDLVNRPFGKVRIRHNIGKKAHNFGKQEKLLHDLSDEIYRRQKQGRAKLPRK